MNFKIIGRDIVLTKALREYVLTKLNRITRHYNQAVSVTVVLTVQKFKDKGLRQMVELTLRVRGRNIIVAQCHEDMYAAIDQLMDRLDRQVVRYKNRAHDHHHESPKSLGLDAGV